MLKNSLVPGARIFFAATVFAVLMAVTVVAARAENPSAPTPDSWSSSSVDGPVPAAPAPVSQDGLNGPNTVSSKLHTHLALEAGGGLNFPSKAINAYNTTGYNGTLGAGWMFTPVFGTLVEYQFLANGLTDYEKISLSAGYCSQTQETICANGNTRINSISVAPVLYFLPESKFNAYFTLGMGVYRKTTNTSVTDVLGAGTTTNASYSATRLGYNFGLGLTKQTGWNSHAKYFLETRFLRVDTTKPFGLNPNSVGRTSLFPVTVGIRY